MSMRPTIARALDLTLRVYVEFRTGVGEKRFGWLDADHVMRTA